MAITVNLRYTGKNGAAQAFAREMISSGTVEKIRAERCKEKTSVPDERTGQ